MNCVLLSICTSLLAFTVLATSEPHYIITIPAQMQHSSSDRACVTFMSMTRSLKIRLELQRGDRVHVLAEDMMDILNYSRCFLFRVPAVEEKEQVWSFHALVQGDDINFNQSKKVLITNGNQVMFIQTDKPLYKPGQTVRFRVATLDKTLRASNDTYPVVELLDPQRNRIAQWRNVSPINGIADFTFPLAEELTLGEYKISIPNRLEKTFSVSEYISKRFEVLINVPSMVTDEDKSFTIDACGRYNYGKPVMGALNISICQRKVYAWTYFIYEDEETPPEGCQVLPLVQTETNGCVSKDIDFDFSNTGNTYFYTKLEIFCTLTELNTGQMEKAFAVISIENRRQTIRFVEIGNYYQKGVPFTGMIKVEDKRGEPQQDKVVFLEVINDDTKCNVSLRTDRLGIARFTLNTSEWNDTVLVTGKFSLDEVDEVDEEDSLPYKWLSPFYSESKSFLKVESIADTLECDSEQRIRVDYYLNKNLLDPQAEHLSFFYMILAKGGIIRHGEHKVNVPEQRSAATHPSSFYLEIPVTSDLFPEASLLVFTVLMNGEMVAGLGKYTLAKCLKSKVELEFSEKKVRPGRKVNLEIKAESGSLCSVRSVDKGVLLHQSHTGTSKSSILDGIKEWIINTGVYDFPNIPEDFEEYRCLEKEALEQTQRQHPWYHGTSDVYSLFKESGLKVFTNTKIKQPVTCLTPEFTLRSFDGVVQLSAKPKASRVSNSNENSEKVRTFFPDTWLYDLVPIGPKGLAILNVTAPDSITSWVTDAFCLWKSGFGETNAVSLTTFKPYFIDLLLPYSIIQGEELTLTAIVFSYVKQCMMAVVWLSDSPDFTVIQGSRKQYACICADQMASFAWNITAVKIGVVKLSVRSSAARQEGGCTERDFHQWKKLRSDALVKSVIVKPSGILQEAAETFFLCPSGSSVQEDVSFHVPDDVVQGSEHAHVSMHGDIMGKATENLGHLLRLPHGCGEQNIAIFAPNIYIMQYLESTKQLTPELKRRALTYLTTGYQRQLMFKHDDGSYSAFGKRDPQGNTWLTAFVLRSFGQAREFIYIEEKHIQDAVRWLSNLQTPSGCFKSVGTLFNNILKSQVEDEVTFAAYITMALLESGAACNDSVVLQALRCLKSRVNVSNAYSQVLLAYVFTLSGDGDMRLHMLKLLEKKARSEGGAKHWALDSPGNGAVEMSSYVVLALLSAKTVSMRDLAGASNIVRWIIKQQNPWGGFYSTQDTVVALHALSKYAKATFLENEDVKVKIRSLSGFQKQFVVDKSKGLLVQSATLPHVPGKYTVTAAGTGCVYVQTYLKYHIPPRKSEVHFVLRASTRPALCTSETHGSFEVLVGVSYVGNRVSTNMVIVEVELLSGFISVEESVKKLQNNPLIKRTESSAGKVTVYLEELTRQTEEVSFFITQEYLVRNLHPASVHVYDYYNPGERSEVEYTAPCRTESKKEGSQ